MATTTTVTTILTAAMMAAARPAAIRTLSHELIPFWVAFTLLSQVAPLCLKVLPCTATAGENLFACATGVFPSFSSLCLMA
jgi:hypothetical protein